MIDHQGTLENPRTTWKSINYVVDRQDLRNLQGAWASSRGVLGQYTIQMSRNGIETNLPWSELRAWFRSANVPLRGDRILTNRKPLWELYEGDDD